MYYKIEKQSELGLKIAELLKRVELAKKEVFEYIDSIGAQETILKSSDYLVGGIRGLYFKNNPDSKLYSQVKGEIGAFFPRKKTNNDVYNKIVFDLPKIERSEIDKLVGFESQFVGFTHCRHVGFSERKECYLVVVSDIAEYTLVEGMIEILASEYKQLSETNEN